MRGLARPILIALGVVALLLSPLDPAPVRAAGKSAVRDPSPCDPACELDRFLNLNIGVTERPMTLAQLRRLGKLESETETPAEGGITVRELEFPGLEIRVYAPKFGAAIVEGITVSGSGFKMPFGLQLDSSPADIQALLGPPTETTPLPPDRVRWLYRTHGGTSIVAFDIEKDSAIKSVEWDFTGDYLRRAKAKGK